MKGLREHSKEEIEEGIDFLMKHFVDYLEFPRKISTFNSHGAQFPVISKKQLISSFISANFVDCRISAFPYLKENKSWPSDLIFIDIDKANFNNDGKSLERALKTTIKNIKEKINGHPTVLFTGGGYHIYQPIKGIELNEHEEFNRFDNPFDKFMRFAKDYLSKGKADKNNFPGLKSCLLRVPNSINSKYNTKIRIVQEWDEQRPDIRLLLGDFHVFLVDEENKITHNNFSKSNFIVNLTNMNNKIEWIEKLLETPLEDYRKYCLWRILCPYLNNVKKLSYGESFSILKAWLEKCSHLRKLDFSMNSELRIRLKNVNNYYPISYKKLIVENKDLYDIIKMN